MHSHSHEKSQKLNPIGRHSHFDEQFGILRAVKRITNQCDRYHIHGIACNEPVINLKYGYDHSNLFCYFFFSLFRLRALAMTSSTFVAVVIFFVVLCLLSTLNSKNWRFLRRTFYSILTELRSIDSKWYLFQN